MHFHFFALLLGCGLSPFKTFYLQIIFLLKSNYNSFFSIAAKECCAKRKNINLELLQFQKIKINYIRYFLYVYNKSKTRFSFNVINFYGF
jgi:hypothetical protein